MPPADPDGVSSAALASSLCLREVLALPPLERARVAAGEAGLGNAVRAVHVIEQPELEPWVRGGELLLSTGLGWQFTDAAAEAFISSAARLGVAGLALAVGRFHQGFSEPMVRTAEALSLPLIELPFALPFLDITEAVTLELLRRREALIERADAIHRALTQAAVFARGLADLSDALCAALGTGVAFSDPGRRILAISHRSGASATWERLAPDDSLPQHWQSTESNLEPRLGPTWLACAVRDASGFRGALWLERDPTLSQHHSPDLESRVIVHAATVFALHLAQHQTRGLIETRLNHNVVDGLLEGLWAEDSALQERARLLGFEPRTAHRILLVVPIAEQAAASSPEGFRAREALAARVATALADLGAARLVTVNLGRVIALVPDQSDLLARLCARLKAPELRLVLGGAVKTPAQLKAGLQELERLNRGLSGAGLFRFEDLVLSRVLSSIADREAVTALIHDSFEALHDEPSLQRTLEVLVQTGFHQARSAERLGVHWNTLKYRLSKLEARLGFRASDPEAVFRLTLALRLRMQGMGGVGTKGTERSGF